MVPATGRRFCVSGQLWCEVQFPRCDRLATAKKYPSNASLTIDGVVVNTFAATAGFSTMMDGVGMPQMGSLATTMDFTIDIHDQVSIPFTTVKKLYDLCMLPTQDKVKQIDVHFWTDEKRTDVICQLSFQGWISSWVISSGSGGNHVLAITVQPQLKSGQFIHVDLKN